jgi:hypothetical protein
VGWWVGLEDYWDPTFSLIRICVRPSGGEHNTPVRYVYDAAAGVAPGIELTEDKERILSLNKDVLSHHFSSFHATVFGEIKDDASFQLLDLVYEKPTRDQAGMHMLMEPIKFTMRLETQPAEAQQRQL